MPKGFLPPVISLLAEAGATQAAIAASSFSWSVFLAANAANIVALGAFYVYAERSGLFRGPKQRGDNDSALYGFAGTTNTRQEGQSIAAVYGNIRYAGQILNEFTTVNQTTGESSYWVAIGMGIGPLHQIGNQWQDTPSETPLTEADVRGLYLNGNSVENFSGVKAWVRMGTYEQDHAPGFEEIRTGNSVDTELTSAVTTSANNTFLMFQKHYLGWDFATTPLDPDGVDHAALWAAHKVSYDFTTEYDGVEIVTNFPEGLYYISNSSGTAQLSNYDVVARYIELDGGGSEITVGGENGDGYIYAPHTPRISRANRRSFQHSLRFDFKDPSTYNSSSAGSSYLFDGTPGEHLRTTGASSSNKIINYGDASDFTMSCWAKPSVVPILSGNTLDVHYDEHKGVLAWNNIAIGFERVPPSGTAGLYRYHPVGYCQNSGFMGSGAVRPEPYDLLSVDADEWVHIAFKQTHVTGTNVASLHVNGVRVNSVSGLSHPSSNNDHGQFLVGASYAEDTSQTSFADELHGEVDQAFMWNRALSDVEISDLYNGGAGTSLAVPSDGLVVGWNFNVDYAGSPVESTYTTPLNLSLTVTGSPPGFQGLGSGRVREDGYGGKYRGKFRVDVMRLNVSSSAGRTSDRTDWTTAYGIIDEPFSYPGIGMLYMTVDGSEQLNTSAPTVEADLKGRMVPVLASIAEGDPTFLPTYSASPPWIATDIATNVDFGGGDMIEASKLTLDTFIEHHEHCSEMVPDNIDSTLAAVTEFTDITYYRSISHKQVVPIASRYQPADDSAAETDQPDGRGLLVVQLVTNASPPTHWQAATPSDRGTFVGLYGLPTDSHTDVLIDLNENADPWLGPPSGDGGYPGFEILKLTRDSNGDRQAWLAYSPDDIGATAPLDPWDEGTAYSSSGMSLLSSLDAGLPDMTGVVEGLEHRWEFNGVFDTLSDVWTSMGRALGVGQGTPIREGDTIRIHIDKERSVSGLATMGSTLVGEESTFIGSYLSPKKRPNQVTVDFLDANNAFRPTTATWTDPDIDAPGDASYINTSGFEGHGITKRGQATRHAMLAVNKNKLQTRSGSFKSGASVMAWQVGDVINISNDLIPRGQGGRIASHASTSDTVIYLDTDVIIAASSSIKVFRIESGEITTVTVTTTGSQAAGSPITVATLGVTPQAGDEFLIYTAAELLSGEVTRRTTDQSRTSTIEWIEYPGSSVYVDRLPTAVTETAFGPSPRIATATLPDPATSVTAEDRISQDPRTGEFRRVVQVSWTHPSRTAVALRETVIYARSEDGEWEQVAKAEGHQTSATFTLPGAQFGEIYEVAFQPVAVEGQRKPARFCSSIRLAMSAVPELPDAPTGLAAVLDGDHAVYSWTLPSPELKVQIRRGGWVLGQIVGTSEPGATSMRTEDWIRYGAGSWGGDNLTLYARTMNAAGEFSKTADSLDTFNPSPEDAEDLITVLEWADYGDDQPAGWGSALTPDPDNVVLTDMALHASGYLEFTGSALTASAEMAAMGYDSTYWPVAYDNDIRPVRTYVHAAAEIEQVKADFTTPLWDTTDTRYDRYLTEGPMTIHGDETVNCTAKIMWKYRAKEGDAFTPYQEYTPGIARPYEVRFRLDFTRPDTTYNLKVHRFSTYLTEVPPQKNERGPLQSFGWNVVNG